MVWMTGKRELVFLPYTLLPVVHNYLESKGYKMATKLERLIFPVLAVIALVLLVSLVVYFSANPVPQTELHLGCTENSLRLELIAPAVIYGDTYDWDTLFGPKEEIGNLAQGTAVCVVAHDSLNQHYAQIVFPDPNGTGREDQYVRGWVRLETLPIEATTALLSINDPWEHPLP
jgi:hypothetical protein